MPPTHCIFWDYFISPKIGGPAGYLAHLRSGLDKLPYNSDIMIWIDRFHEELTTPWNVKNLSEKYLMAQISYFENPENFELDDAQFERLMRVQPVSVHLHSSPLAYKVARTFRRRRIAGIPIMLTSHTPESNGKEMSDQYRAAGLNLALADKLETAVRMIEALSFRSADIWVFPSQEAMEPYLATVPDFRRWMADKDIRFVPTGARRPETSILPGEAKARLGVEGRKVLSFLGRHNEVKGYDIFREAALLILTTRDDVVVVVGGQQNSAIPSPRHERWIELGWHSFPGDVLAASDVFVLPNRMTYFDLVLIEALAMRTKTIASATGGNKSVATITDGAISLFDGTIDDLCKKINVLLDDEQLNVELNVSSLFTAYEKHFTEVAFAARYEAMVAEVHKDYRLSDQPKKIIDLRD